MKMFLKQHISERAVAALRAVVSWWDRLGSGGLMLLWSFIYDYRRYRKWSSVTTGPNTESKLQAHIVIDYHSLEKGLAYPDPRPDFGRPVARRLMRYCDLHLARYGLSQELLDAIGAMRQYCQFQEQNDIDISEISEGLELLEKATADSIENVRGGTTTVTAEEIRAATHGVGDAFFLARHSARQFTDVPVSRQLIEESLRRAQRTPSTCNRQCARVHVLTDAETIAKALSFQHGNRGFGHQAGVVFIVTADLTGFTHIGERFQGWIDGGMYAMSLIYALHSLGLGSCSLNWSEPPDDDRRMRGAMDIPDNELVIMMLAAGHIPKSFEVASSPRPPIEATTRFVP